MVNPTTATGWEVPPGLLPRTRRGAGAGRRLTRVQAAAPAHCPAWLRGQAKCSRQHRPAGSGWLWLPGDRLLPQRDHVGAASPRGTSATAPFAGRGEKCIATSTSGWSEGEAQRPLFPLLPLLLLHPKYSFSISCHLDGAGPSPPITHWGNPTAQRGPVEGQAQRATGCREGTLI